MNRKNDDALARAINAHAAAVTRQTEVEIELMHQLQRISAAHSDVAREQHITNLIAIASSTADPIEQRSRIEEARHRMDQPSRSNIHTSPYRNP